MAHTYRKPKLSRKERGSVSNPRTFLKVNEEKRLDLYLLQIQFYKKKRFPEIPNNRKGKILPGLIKIDVKRVLKRKHVFQFCEESFRKKRLRKQKCGKFVGKSNNSQTKHLVNDNKTLIADPPSSGKTYFVQKEVKNVTDWEIYIFSISPKH